MRNSSENENSMRNSSESNMTNNSENESSMRNSSENSYIYQRYQCKTR
jgi:hypothetical protein